MVSVVLDQLRIVWQFISDIIARAFYRSEVTQGAALDTPKAFGKVWHTDLHKLKCYGISGLVFVHILSFHSSRWFQVVLYGKFSQEYQVNAWFPQGYILGPTLFPRYTNDPPDDVIDNIGICADDMAIYSKFGQVSDLW